MNAAATKRPRPEASSRRSTIRFDKVIVSGLPRTIETAQRVLAETGQECRRSMSGRNGKRSAAARLSNLPVEGYRSARFSACSTASCLSTTAFLGGETIGELLDRVLPPLQRLRDDSSWDTALLVLARRRESRVACRTRSRAADALFFGHLSQTTGCINALDIGDKHRRLGHPRAESFAAVAPSRKRAQHDHGIALSNNSCDTRQALESTIRAT